jgi:uncharacterized protein with ParB-like and HNH nuclease domain
MIIDSKPWQIGSLLEGKYFQIPRYQRPYSWEKSHLEEFWQDAIQDREEVDYFIGSIVAAKPRNEVVYAVVDGQQRLTTITILLCVLRNAFQRENLVDLSQGTHTLIERKNRENVNQYILTTQTSYPYWQEHILKYGDAELDGGAGPEEEALAYAKSYFEERILEVVSAIRNNPSLSQSKKTAQIEKNLKSLREKLLSLLVIFVELEDEDDAYLAFETLNTRGKDLRATDLVKNLVLRLKKPSNRGVDVAKDKWQKMSELIEDSDATIRLDTFLHHSWLSRNEFVAQKKLFISVKKRVDKASVDDYLDELVGDAKIYRFLYETETREKKWIQQEFAIRDAIEAVGQIGVRISLPLILAVVRDWQDGAMAIPGVRDILRTIESFHFIYNAVTEQRVTGGLAMMFATQAWEFSQSPPNSKVAKCREIRKKLKERLPSLDAFKLAFNRIVYTKAQTKQKNLVKYILGRIAAHNSWTLDRRALSIEHLSSQSSSIAPSIVGQIGNLLLVPGDFNNEKLADRPVPDKIRLLKKAQIPIPDTMGNSKKWDEMAIASHTEELAELCYNKIWRL